MVSSAVPLVGGGARFIAEWLAEKLRAAGHEAELVQVPSTDEPDWLLPQMNAFRLLELDGAFDRVVTLRPPAHAVRHRCKIVWFIHHVRAFYDLWDTPYRGFADTPAARALRAALVRADTAALREARRVFANSRVVADRLRRYNGVEARVLYPPVLRPALFAPAPYGDEVVSVCRMEHHKRQHLLVRALAEARTPVRLRLCGVSSSTAYVEGLRAEAARLGVAHRLSIEERWISEDEKAARLGVALASAYLPHDEDSYGYPTLEAAHAERCTVTASDAGGVAEFVQDGVTGLSCPPEPAAVGAAFDRLWGDRALAARLGRAARDRVAALGIDWDTVLAAVLE